MLSYLHTFHAGNRADIHKHGMVYWLLQQLVKKDKPFTYLDFYAGRGLYDLTSADSLKTMEAKAGIEQIIDQSWLNKLQDWQDLLKVLNPEGRIRYYPGSSWLASQLLRTEDKGQFCELHPTEYQALRKNFANNPNLYIHQRDAHEALLGLLPPHPKRGLAFIDPSYEVKEEYRKLADLISKAYEKWSVGRYMLWYPLLATTDYHQAMVKKLAKLPRWCQSEWQWANPNDVTGLYGSGILLINPPWGISAFCQAWHSQLKRWFPHSQTRFKEQNP
ncbi:23S rRNA (adenine(2030)-N(6))-methyltransferase RlmJ [Candidatus Nitrosacidococcus tergens]|uniref:Ribosomal RNA large subunit methyltransferase J n=1 Tax=Candidatus Nitrosacidococcus tergens TaxID=553981 RepID=A0A7G1Q9H8_9GAMM|nr:23S rRNA (adenine(2030)-N(6))-methyltransferase RlmJ [Candidatus Nitrosacidococcus tergens]CAB1275759.1 Ribosomal RNA large subunit methyltransferase J [Candidatus Nitrosacidococcus tergens]